MRNNGEDKTIKTEQTTKHKSEYMKAPPLEIAFGKAIEKLPKLKRKIIIGKYK
jgi:hypothetical protein